MAVSQATGADLLLLLRHTSSVLLSLATQTATVATEVTSVTAASRNQVERIPENATS